MRYPHVFPHTKHALHWEVLLPPGTTFHTKSTAYEALWGGIAPLELLLDVLHLKLDNGCKWLISLDLRAAALHEPAYKPATKHTLGWNHMKRARLATTGKIKLDHLIKVVADLVAFQGSVGGVEQAPAPPERRHMVTPAATKPCLTARLTAKVRDGESS